MEDQGFGLPGDIEKHRTRLMAHYWGKPIDVPVNDLVAAIIELEKIKTAIAMELYRVNNPSAWDSFSQEGSDAIRRIAKSAGIK